MMSSDRPGCSMRSTWVNGSSRAPNRDLVRRTPLATARTRPFRLVRMLMMRSASPSFWVRSTIPSSRYRLTQPFSRTPGCARPRRAAGHSPRYSAARGPVQRGEHRTHRGGRRVRVDAHPPPDPAADLAFHVRGGLRVAARGQRVLGVVEHPDVDADAGQRVTERGDGPVAGALYLARLAIHLDLHAERVLRVHHG